MRFQNQIKIKILTVLLFFSQSLCGEKSQDDQKYLEINIKSDKKKKLNKGKTYLSFVNNKRWSDHKTRNSKIQKDCIGFVQGTMLEYPKKKPPKPPKPINVYAGVLFSQGKVLLRQRPSKGLLAGMWEFPSVEAKSGSEGLRELKRLFEESSFSNEIGDMVCGVEHIFSHRIWDLRAYGISTKKMPKKLPPNWAWHPWNLPEEILWAGPHRKIADYLFNE